MLPRFGAAYDLFGDGKTAIKGHVGIYTAMMNVGFQSRYNPMAPSTDTRTWTDLNGNDIAQENEMGPSTNTTFGIRRNRNPDPNIKRPTQTLYSLGLQHELRPGVGLSVSFYRREYDNLSWTDNLATTLDDYTLITLPDPRGNGETIPLYNLSVAKRGLINELDTAGLQPLQDPVWAGAVQTAVRCLQRPEREPGDDRSPGLGPGAGPADADP